MVDFLKTVKVYSLIIMTIIDKTSWHIWNQNLIDYVDGYGSNTVVRDGAAVRTEGCPFIFGESKLSYLSV